MLLLFSLLHDGFVALRLLASIEARILLSSLHRRGWMGWISSTNGRTFFGPMEPSVSGNASCTGYSHGRKKYVSKKRLVRQNPMDFNFILLEGVSLCCPYCCQAQLGNQWETWGVFMGGQPLATACYHFLKLTLDLSRNWLEKNAEIPRNVWILSAVLPEVMSCHYQWVFFQSAMDNVHWQYKRARD